MLKTHQRFLLDDQASLSTFQLFMAVAVLILKHSDSLLADQPAVQCWTSGCVETAHNQVNQSKPSYPSLNQVNQTKPKSQAYANHGNHGDHLHSRKPWKHSNNRKSWRWHFFFFKLNDTCRTEIWVLLTSNLNIFVVTVSALGVVAGAALKRKQLWELTCRAGIFQRNLALKQHAFHPLQMQALCLTACWKKEIRQIWSCWFFSTFTLHHAQCALHCTSMVWNKSVTLMTCFMLNNSKPSKFLSIKRVLRAS